MNNLIRNTTGFFSSLAERWFVAPKNRVRFPKKHKIGFIPKTDNRIFYKLIKVGLAKYIRVVIQQVSPHEHPENQIQIVAHLIK